MLETPCRKARLATECWQPPPCSHKRLLGDLARLVVILQHVQTHIEDAALVSLHEEGKGILVPLLTRFHKVRVILLGLPGDDAWEG